MYHVTKRFGHERGLSCAFRQWRADHSHCRYLHGYALAITLEFEAKHLDDCNWVIDFGGFGNLKEQLAELYDHRTVVARDDPQRHYFEGMSMAGVIDLRIADVVGCEAFALEVYALTAAWLSAEGMDNGVRLVKATVSEHEGNSASYSEPRQ